MKNISVIIIDDEPLARERIRELLKNHNGIDVAAECKNGEEAVREINKYSPDLIFLDIQMPKMNGFDVITKLEKIPAIIFVTAYDEYAIKAFEINALDYLLKPFDKERFEAALNRARNSLINENSQLNQKLENLLNGLVHNNKEYIDRFVIKTGGRIYFVNSNDVDWFEADGNYVKLHIGSKTELIRETIKTLEEKLDPGKFIRVHRSSIIKIDSIKELVNWFGSEYKIKLKNGDEVVTGKKYKENINKLIK